MVAELGDRIEAGDRVILASAKRRGRDVLGTVIETDPYEDRDVLVRVLFEDKSIRWRRRDDLRRLGHRTSPEALAAALELNGIAVGEYGPAPSSGVEVSR